MSFTDIFNSSFLEKVTAFSALDMLIAMSVSFGLGVFIYMVYRRTYRGVVYSDSFAVSLIAMTLITTMVILAVTSNVVLSLGMVGALSIVRFRSAVKEPLDISFIFWAMVVGIVTGAGLIPLAVFGSVFIGILLIYFVNRHDSEQAYVLVVKADNEVAEKELLYKLSRYSVKYIVQAKLVHDAYSELTVDVRLDANEQELIHQLGDVQGLSDLTLVSYNGDYLA